MADVGAAPAMNVLLLLLLLSLLIRSQHLALRRPLWSRLCAERKCCVARRGPEVLAMRLAKWTLADTNATPASCHCIHVRGDRSRCRPDRPARVAIASACSAENVA